MNDDTKAMIHTAQHTWRGVMAAAGLPHHNIDATVLHSKNAAREKHVLLRLNGAGLIFKQGFGPHATLVIDAARTVQQAHARLQDTPQYTAPEIVFIDPDHNAVLMQDMGGQTAEDWVLGHNLSVAARLEMLARAGGWVAAHMAAQPDETASLGCKFMTRKLDALGANKGAYPQDFQRYCRAAAPLITQAHGRPVPRAQPHGDLILHNLILTDTQTVGIDLRARDRAPIGLDIANFLVDYASLYGADQMRAGSVLDGDEHAAFFADLDDTDASILPHVLFKTLTRWARIDPSSLTRSARQSRRLQGLRRIMAHLVG